MGNYKVGKGKNRGAWVTIYTKKNLEEVSVAEAKVSK